MPTPPKTSLREHGPVVAVVAVGGGIGAEARFGLARLWPAPAGHFPWATFVTNVTGCLAIGILMVLVTEMWSPHRLLRPFLGTGILGGYTTFSTYAVDIVALLEPGHVAVAATYLVVTLVCALSAVLLGVTATRALLALRHRPHRQETTP